MATGDEGIFMASCEVLPLCRICDQLVSSQRQQSPADALSAVSSQWDVVMPNFTFSSFSTS